jgi:hypothetical protein
MRLETVHLSNSRRVLYEGTEDQVKGALINDHKWLARKYGETGDINFYLRCLVSEQAYMVNLKKDPEQLQKGYSNYLDRCVSAASFLGNKDISPEEIRTALLITEDPEKAALHAADLPVDEETIKQLRAILSTSDLSKSEQTFSTIENVSPSGHEVVEEIRLANSYGKISKIDLNGVHSHGTLRADIPGTNRSYLLKKGSGPQSPAAGAKESASTQSQREACFYECSKMLGIENVPQAVVLLLDGQEFAAIRMLPDDYKTIGDMLTTDPIGVQRLLSMYSLDIYKWATVDLILGNPDRHNSNIMARHNDVQLIDHGSAFAGNWFDPAHDKYSFIPYYLRYNNPDFGTQDAATRLKKAVRLNSSQETELQEWLKKMGPIDDILTGYGIMHGPCQNRRARVLEAVKHSPADLAIMGCWIL